MVPLQCGSCGPWRPEFPVLGCIRQANGFSAMSWAEVLENNVWHVQNHNVRLKLSGPRETRGDLDALRLSGSPAVVLTTSAGLKELANVNVPRRVSERRPEGWQHG